MKARRKKILYFIQLPPPVHGVSVINKLVYGSKSINKDLETHLLEVNFTDTLEGLRKYTIII